jgi:hypothetical protein
MPKPAIKEIFPMTSSTYQFDFKDLNLSSSQIEAVLGYNKDDDRSYVIYLIEEVLKDAQEISDIKAQLSIFDNVAFDNGSKSVEINEIIFSLNKIVFTQLRKSESVALFLCTAGAEIGKRSRIAMQERDFLTGYIYDVVGSEIVEAAVDLLQSDLEKIMLISGRKITNRYSPGYCKWDVAEQHKLFSLLPENYCGIHLTSSALMEPEKSVSGIIGIGKNVKTNPYTCRMCDLEDCTFRRVRDKMVK